MKDFVDGLSVPWKKTMAKSRGDAYHKLLELGPDQFLNIETGGELTYKIHEPQLNKTWVFSEAQAMPAVETFIDHPGKKHEVWGRLNISLTNYDVVMNLRVDALETPVIWDYKTTARPPKKETYEDSLQWPLYMMAYPDCTLFRFRVFHLLDYGCNQFDFLFDKDTEREKKAMTWLTGLVDFIEKNELEKFFLHPSQQSKLAYEPI